MIEGADKLNDAALEAFEQLERSSEKDDVDLDIDHVLIIVKAMTLDGEEQIHLHMSDDLYDSEWLGTVERAKLTFLAGLQTGVEEVELVDEDEDED